MYKIKYRINHGGGFIEDVETSWINDVAFLEGALNRLKDSNAIDIRVIKQVDVTSDFI